MKSDEGCNTTKLNEESLKSIQCWNCDEIGHLKRHCPQIKCFYCKGPHLKRHCTTYFLELRYRKTKFSRKPELENKNEIEQYKNQNQVNNEEPQVKIEESQVKIKKNGPKKLTRNEKRKDG